MSETNLQLFPGVFRSTIGGENPGFFLHSDGRVGIGNKAPTAKPLWSSNNADRNKLNVTGHTHIEGNLNVTGHLYGDGSTLSGVAAVIGGYWDLDASNNNISYSVGNVKIGTGTPNANLDVVGSARVSNVVTIGTTKTYVVTVSDASGANKYYIDGVKQPYLTLHQHQTYLFDLTAPGVGHPFRLAMEANGGGGQPLGSLPASDYTTGTDYTSVANHLKFTVPSGAPSTLYYYCTQHSGMGGTVSISSEAELIVSGRFESTGTGGISLGGGTTAQRPTYAPLGTMRYNSTIGFMEAYMASGWSALNAPSPPSIESVSPVSVLLADTATQVFTVSGASFDSGLAINLVGADGTNYDVVDATFVNGATATFKMGAVAGVSSEFPPSAMTSDTSIEGYTVSSSYPNTPYLAFNDSTSNWWYSGTQAYLTNAPFLASSSVGVTQDISGTSHRGHWIQLQIPSSVILTRTILGNPNEDRAYGQFVILGSNDGTYWTLLHSGNGVVNTQSTDVTTLSAGSAEAFSYFRIVITSKRNGNGNGQLQINNIQFFGGNGASWDLAQRPYKVKITGGSGLATTSTQTINFPGTSWTSPAAGATLSFSTSSSSSQTLAGTDAAGGTSGRTFAVAPSSNPLPSPLSLNASTGVISGTIGAINSGTNVTFRVVDVSGVFVERTFSIVGTSSLYAFSSHTFTDAGQTGRTGPTITHARNTYNVTWDTNTNFFNVTAGIQLWTVPRTGTYEFELGGSRGGVRESNSLANVPGYGALIEGARLNLVVNDKLKILVGQLPDPYVASNGPGGGGGTFVTTDAATPVPYLVAGGGGGAHNGSQPNFPQTNNYGTASNRGPTTVAIGRSSAGGGGGSFNGQGTPANFGRSFINGGLGGDYHVDGGFGGGGGSKNSNSYNGGGGGYSGGDELTNGGIAFGLGSDYGGGGSYENSSYVTGATLTTGGNNGKISGDRGYVKITFIS